MEELIGGMPSWTEDANCKGADADIFFPERGCRKPGVRGTVPEDAREGRERA